MLSSTRCESPSRERHAPPGAAACGGHRRWDGSSSVAVEAVARDFDEFSRDFPLDDTTRLPGAEFGSERTAARLGFFGRIATGARSSPVAMQPLMRSELASCFSFFSTLVEIGWYTTGRPAIGHGAEGCSPGFDRLDFPFMWDSSSPRAPSLASSIMRGTVPFKYSVVVV